MQYNYEKTTDIFIYVMWAIKLKPIIKQRWENCFDSKYI